MDAAPMDAVTTEIGYIAFPSAVRQGARDWVAYRHGSGHASPDGHVRVRFRDEGFGWSDPIVVVPDTPGDIMLGPAGMTVDATGRVYMAVMRARSTGPNTAMDYVAYLTWHDPLDPPEVWAPLRQVPVPPALVGTSYGLVISGVHVHNGEVLVAGYGQPPTTDRWTAYIIAYNGTFTQRGSYAHPDRHFTEPQLVTMQDGRLLSVVRSDTSVPYYSYLHVTISSDAGATWSPPFIVAQHATGLPSPVVLPTGEIAVPHRGFAEPKNPSAAGYPLRVAMLRPDGTAANPIHEQSLDLIDDERLYLYGAWLDTDEFVIGVENSPASAQVYSVPIVWETRST